MIPETVTLAFDPADESEEIKTIFANDLARTIWLAVKFRHLTTSHFNSSCLHFAAAIKKARKKRPLTSTELSVILSGGTVPPAPRIIGSNEADFVDELLPLVNGEKILDFEIE